MKTTYKGYVANIILDNESKRVDVTLTDHNEEIIEQWHTNNAGEGRFLGIDYTQQTDGTCQYAIKGTSEAIRNKVRKEMITIIDELEQQL